MQIAINQNEILEFAELVDQIKDLARQLLTEWIRGQQEQLLQQLLGDKWQRLADRDIGLACPGCGSISLRRKAWRDRRIAVAELGRVRVPRRQLSCIDCGHCWMPFAEQLHAPAGQYGSKLLDRALDRVLESSYQKAARATAEGPSGSTLHRCVQELQAPDPPEEAQQVVCDGTEIPAWRQRGHINVSMAHQIGPPTGERAPNGRPVPREREVVAVTAGQESNMKRALEAVDIRALVHDGNLQLTEQARWVGRCSWHVPYTVGYLLYTDDIRGQDNKARVEHLREAIHGVYQGPAQLRNALTHWLGSNGDAPKAGRHVIGSFEGLMTMAAHPEAFTVTTTSHVEREMREVNKRFENGGGWTPDGARKLLWLHQLNRYEPKRYEKVKYNLIKQTVFPN